MPAQTAGRLQHLQVEQRALLEPLRFEQAAGVDAIRRAAISARP